MPLYEYACETCGERFDALRSAARADDPAECSHCGAAHSHRLISRFAAMTKGSNGSQSIGGSGRCGSCAGGHCATCGSH